MCNAKNNVTKDEQGGEMLCIFFTESEGNIKLVSQDICPLLSIYARKYIPSSAALFG